MTKPQPATQETALRHAHQALGQLVTDGQSLGAERIQPQENPYLDVCDHQVGEVRTGTEQDQADRDPRTALGGDIEHRDEDTEEQQ